MSAKILFDFQLSIYQILGFRFTYPNGLRGALSKCWAFFNFFMVFQIVLFQVFYLLSGRRSVEEVSPVVSLCFAFMEVLVGMATFYWKRNDFKFIICGIVEFFDHGRD